jgi:hypothetical protein
MGHVLEIQVVNIFPATFRETPFRSEGKVT